MEYRFYQGIRKVTHEEFYLIAVPCEPEYAHEIDLLPAAMEDYHDAPQGLLLESKLIDNAEWSDIGEMRLGSAKAPDVCHQDNMLRLLGQMQQEEEG